MNQADALRFHLILVHRHFKLLRCSFQLRDQLFDRFHLLGTGSSLDHFEAILRIDDELSLIMVTCIVLVLLTLFLQLASTQSQLVELPIQMRQLFSVVYDSLVEFYFADPHDIKVCFVFKLLDLLAAFLNVSKEVS